MEKKCEFSAEFTEDLTADTQRALHAISVRGERHRQQGAYNQDCFCCALHSRFTYLATADGLGSSPFSHIGAKKAVSLFEEIVVGAIEYSGGFDEVAFPFLLHYFHERWLQFFGEDVKQYDTTFQYIIVFDDVALCGSIGDGLLMIASNKELLFEKQNEEFFSNQTNSLASEKALGSLQMHVVSLREHKKLPMIFILATDGISDDLKSASVVQLPSYLIKQRQSNTGAAMQHEIGQWVMNWKTSNHTDDRTFCFYLIEKVGEVKWN